MPLIYENTFASLSARIIATVNGDMISQLEFDKALRSAIVTQQLDKKDATYAANMEKMKQDVLTALINEKILLQEAKKQNITVSDKQLEQEITNLIAKTGLDQKKFEHELIKENVTLKDFQKKTRSNIVRQELINRNVYRRIIVKDQEILDYYKNKGGNISGGVNVALIIYPSKKIALEYEEDLIHGEKNFFDVAKTISIGPLAENGGEMGMLSVNDLAPAIQSMLKKVAINNVSKVFTLGQDQAQIKFLAMEAPSDDINKIMGDSTRMQIENTLKQAKVEEYFQVYLKQLRLNALIDIRR